MGSLLSRKYRKHLKKKRKKRKGELNGNNNR